MNKLSKINKPLTPRMQLIIQAVFDNPTKNQRELAKMLGLSNQRISQILRHPRVLEAFPTIAKARIKGMVPKAAGRLESLMKQNVNLEVARKVTERILDTEKVLSPETKINVNVFASMSTADLHESVLEAQKLKANDVFDGEIVDTDDR